MLPRKTEEEFSALLKHAKILETIGGNNKIKVAQLADGRILKLFRQRGFTFTGRIRKPYCLKFKENAERLNKMGIPSVHVDDTFYIPHLRQYASIYPLLPGKSLREVLENSEQTARNLWIKRFAAFVSDLHDKGILFRALHLGNVLITENETFGLIDVADMTFHRQALSLNERSRNFEHITRYERDILLLTKDDPSAFIDAYIQATSNKQEVIAKLSMAFAQGCKNPKLI